MTLQRCPQCAKRLLQVDAFCPSCRLPLQLVGKRFRIERFMASGGFGNIYQARDTHSQDTCVVKLLKQGVDELPGDAQRRNFTLRFQREIKVTSLLSQQNPHIVRIVDHGKSHQYGLYYAMEMLEGLTLRKRLEQSMLPIDRALHVIRQLCNAIQEAHDNDVVHRDLKPDNVFLLQRGDDPLFVKLLDFGIAKTLAGTLNADLTQGILGTPQYLSPEQCSGADVTPRSDIYAIGTLTYELITGAPPFTGKTAMSLVQQHIASPPQPPSARRPELLLPATLDDVILKALAKQPSERYASAWALWEALAPFADPTGELAMRSHDQLPAVMQAIRYGDDLASLKHPPLPTPESETHATSDDDLTPDAELTIPVDMKGRLPHHTARYGPDGDLDAEGPTEPLLTRPKALQKVPGKDSDKADVLPELGLLETVDNPSALGAFISAKEELPAPMALPTPRLLGDLAVLGDIEEVEVEEHDSDEALPASFDEVESIEEVKDAEDAKATSNTNGPTLPTAPQHQGPPSWALTFVAAGAITLLSLGLWSLHKGFFSTPPRGATVASMRTSQPIAAHLAPDKAPTRPSKPPEPARKAPPLRQKALTPQTTRKATARRPQTARKRPLPRRVVRRKVRRPRSKRRPRSRRRSATAAHPCGATPKGQRWVVGTLLDPAHKPAQITFLNCPSCRVTKRRAGYCLAVDQGRVVTLRIRAEGYLFCTHAIASRRRTIRWRLRLDDPDALAVEQYKCFR